METVTIISEVQGLVETKSVLGSFGTCFIFLMSETIQKSATKEMNIAIPQNSVVKVCNPDAANSGS